MPASDGYFILAVANDPTFERFISVALKASIWSLENPKHKMKTLIQNSTKWQQSVNLW